MAHVLRPRDLLTHHRLLIPRVVSRTPSKDVKGATRDRALAAVRDLLHAHVRVGAEAVLADDGKILSLVRGAHGDRGDRARGNETNAREWGAAGARRLVGAREK